MFTIANGTIDSNSLSKKLSSETSGALVIFEGWVRNHNDGQPVTSLEYEIFAELAFKEAAVIISEAKAKFGITNLHCVHSQGHLQIGEIAVWIGVTSAHRDEAFKACRYLIDEIKLRLPIWKKEHYLDGHATWVNCQGCYHHSQIRFDEKAYYSKQICLESIQEQGQKKLKNTKALVVGAGGLGSSALTYLAAAGVGQINVIDFDKVEISNFHRQTLYSFEHLGLYKADVAKKVLRERNPFIKVESFVEKLTPYNVESLIENADVIVDCTDNFQSKFLLHDACFLKQKPLVQASIYQSEGQYQVFLKDSSAGCLRCLWPEIPDSDCVKSCTEVGVLGYVPGILGALQAQETIRWILGEELESAKTSVLLELPSMSVHKITRIKNSKCPLCSHQPKIQSIIAGQYLNPRAPYEINVEDIQFATANEFQFVDIRTTQEVQQEPGKIEMTRISLDHQEAFKALPENRKYVLVCQKGIRSRRLAGELRSQGFLNFYSLNDGIASL